MRSRKIFRNQVTVLQRHFVFLTDDSDAFSAACGDRLQDVKIFEAVHFSISAPSFVVLWEDIGLGAYLEILPVFSSKFLDILPQTSLAANAPRPRKVIDLLILVHVLSLLALYRDDHNML